MPLAFAMVTVLAIIYVVPLVIYGVASTLGGLELPTESSPRQFLLGILVTKIGTAFAFVLLLDVTSAVWADGWLLYGMIWFGMFAASEVGDAISGRSTWLEAWLGILSEAIYAPAAALAAYWLLGIS